MDRSAFDRVCNNLIASTSKSAVKESEVDLRSISLENDWIWIEHSTYPNFGYLERRGLLRKLLPSLLSTPDDLNSTPSSTDDIDTLDEAEDPSSIALTSPDLVQSFIKLNLSVCLSPTFHVPVLYFTAHFTSGTPLTLAQLLNSTIFHPSPSSSSTSGVSNTNYYPHCTLSSSDIRLPYLSQAEHPTTGISSWFLHPCETEGIVKEVLLAENGESSRIVSEESKGENEIRKWELWMKTWLMIVGTLIDLKE